MELKFVTGLVLSLFSIVTLRSQAAILSEPGVFMLPLNCSELLPEPGPFTNYLEAVGRGLVLKDKKLSRRIFRVLAIREKVSEAVDRNRDQHPIDTLVRKTLCFYREQREPLKAVPFIDLLDRQESRIL